ncbi:aldo/keto reductase [Caldivirga maquilingensis]|uniref:Aldo/keto reductase n=1 Tax=Caldivirga maquilingensis (strain ATCC 700844 / DSM 13496 / JCM 10307 / IC-167) TaxID=397948 RepID=A8MBZ6_CALMQ|nr:aldo/keto reductase [Caldivirga maquilingensis]ABW01339.1 aldo/keto reductase [Caldivirga maquilingensis IC-167]
MRYRVLGGTGLKVSEIGLGAWFIGGMYGDVTVDEARAIIKKAIDLGINVFDTADVYGNGLSERILGEELRGYDAYVFTKVGYNIYEDKGSKHTQLFTPNYIKYAALQSIKRLGRRVSLLQLHNPPLEVIRSSGIHETLLGLVKEGYVDHIGVALGPEVNVLNEGLAAIESGYESIMFVFNILEQEPARTLVRLGNGRVGLITRVPHASNLLTSGFTLNFKPGDHRNLRNREWLIRAKAIVDNYIKPISDQLGLTLSQLALKYVLSYPISTVMVTVTSVNELEEYCEAADGSYLNSSLVKSLEELYDNVIAKTAST